MGRYVGFENCSPPRGVWLSSDVPILIRLGLDKTITSAERTRDRQHVAPDRVR